MRYHICYLVLREQSPVLVTMAQWSHLFPSRTQKLSTITATVAGPAPVRIASCQVEESFGTLFGWGNGVIGGTEIGTMTAAKVTGSYGSPNKTYITNDGKFMVYDSGTGNLRYLRVVDDQVVEVFIADPANADMYGIKVGEASTSVISKMTAKFGSAAVTSTDTMITVAKPGYDNPVVSYYRCYSGKVESIQHIGTNIDLYITIKDYKGSLTNEDIASKLIIDLINDLRVKNSKSKLSEVALVTAVAKAYCLDMYTRGFFSATDPSGKDSTARLKAAGYSGSIFTEYIYRLYNHPVELFWALARDKTARSDMLSTSTTKIGVGVIYTIAHGSVVNHEGYFDIIYIK